MEEIKKPCEEHEIECEDCEYHRTESWCALAIPNKQKIDEAYKIRMEGFWEGVHAAENEYNILIQTLDEYDEICKNYEWMLTKDRVPIDNDYVIVTIKDDSGDSPYTYTTVAQYYHRKDFDDFWIADNDYVCGDIIAWMPLPKPYKE